MYICGMCGGNTVSWHPTVHLFSTLGSVMSLWYPDIGHGGSIYTADIGNVANQGFLSREPVVKHFPEHH